MIQDRFVPYVAEWIMPQDEIEAARDSGRALALEEALALGLDAVRLAATEARAPSA